MRHYRVLFVCIGNACRSQMAETFAHAYGSDVLIARSAGLAPAVSIPPVTQRLMQEKDLTLSGRYPKPFDEHLGQFDLVVNMSGMPLPHYVGPVREWEVEDPIRCKEDGHREIRDQIEELVQALVEELRRERSTRTFRTSW